MNNLLIIQVALCLYSEGNYFNVCLHYKATIIQSVNTARNHTNKWAR